MKNHTRYFIVSMLFFASSLNYADRATVSLTKTNLSNSLGLDSVWMGYLLSAWGWSYVVAQLPAGWLLDRFGSKRVYGAGIFFGIPVRNFLYRCSCRVESLSTASL